MKTKILPLFFSILFVCSAITNSSAQWANGQVASNVLGQINFTASLLGLNASGLNSPSAICIDPVTKKIFVADYSNHRILRFSAGSAVTNGAAAEAVLGQSSLLVVSAGTSAIKMRNPFSICMDAYGNLWVADTENGRVLRFDDAATSATGVAANAVLGQPNFTTVNTTASASTMKTPTGVFVRGTTLWVSDDGANRILRFDNAASKANGAAADGVLGQTNFTNTAAGTAANRLYSPYQMTVSTTGDLWVADVYNNRVLKFANAASLPNGAAATVALGQTSLTGTANGTSGTTMYYPTGVALDGSGRLYISEYGNNRVTIFNNAGSLVNGAAATNVIGQSTFSTRTAATSINGMNAPFQIFVDDRLWVPQGTSNRITSYFPSTPLPVHLVEFTGNWTSDKNSTELSWKTSDEEDLKGYELTYSSNGQTFSNVIFHQQALGAGNHQYNFTHSVAASSTNNYYRLKMIDLDGKFTYSQVIRLSKVAIGTISVYPNPAKDQLTFSFPSAKKTSIQFYDLAGRLIKKSETNASTPSINIEELKTGVYQLLIIYDGQNISKKIVKQ